MTIRSGRPRQQTTLAWTCSRPRLQGHVADHVKRQSQQVHMT
jgi:hypothetical protein